MSVIVSLYVVFSAILVVSGLTMVGMAVQAYVRTQRRSMIFVSVGFSLIAAATIATVLSAFLTGFSEVRSLLLVNSGFSSLGFIAVVYSLVIYE
ncbi:MAG: hypothetical protein ABEJ78_05225 [Haloferacaceae archaeon]